MNCPYCGSELPQNSKFLPLLRRERSDGTAAEARAQAEACTGPCTEACAAAKACAQARNGKKSGIADRAGGAARGSARPECLPVFAEPQKRRRERAAEQRGRRFGADAPPVGEGA